MLFKTFKLQSNCMKLRILFICSGDLFYPKLFSDLMQLLVRISKHSIALQNTVKAYICQACLLSERINQVHAFFRIKRVYIFSVQILFGRIIKLDTKTTHTKRILSSTSIDTSLDTKRVFLTFTSYNF